MILSAPSQWVMIAKTSLDKGPMPYFGFKCGVILIEVLVGTRTLVDLQPIFHTMGVGEIKVFDESVFHANWLVDKVFLL